MKSTTKNQFIYIIQAEGTPHYKIGITSNVQDRVRTIQTGCPYRVVVREVYNGDERAEKLLHDRFSAYRGFGEWFTLPLAWRDMVTRGEASQFIIETRAPNPPAAPAAPVVPNLPTVKKVSGVEDVDSAIHSAMAAVCCLSLAGAGWAILSASIGVPFYDASPMAAMPALAAIVTAFHRPFLRLVEQVTSQ